jgi:hypothetical protein
MKHTQSAFAAVEMNWQALLRFERLGPDYSLIYACRQFTGAELRGLGLRAVAEMKRQALSLCYCWH